MSTQGILGDFGRLFFCLRKTVLIAFQVEIGVVAGPHPNPLPKGEGAQLWWYKDLLLPLVLTQGERALN